MRNFTFITGTEGAKYFNKAIENEFYVKLLNNKKVSYDQKETIKSMLYSNLEDNNTLARNIINILKNK